ncbi:MAG: hypothetical protein IJ083_13455 [Clostridia bacterium]|nr:hypothetical protein [Clostridia bacterium]
MYRTEEIHQLSADIKKRWICLAVPLLLLLGIQIYSLTIRSEWLTDVTGVLLCVLFIFFFELTILPLIRYRRHVQDMLTGITHEIEGTFLSFDQEVSMVEGVRFRAMNVQCVDDLGKDYERMFYYDVEKPLPDFQNGDTLRIVYHDRQIASVEKIS